MMMILRFLILLLFFNIYSFQSSTYYNSLVHEIKLEYDEIVYYTLGRNINNNDDSSFLLQRHINPCQESFDTSDIQINTFELDCSNKHIHGNVSNKLQNIICLHLKEEDQSMMRNTSNFVDVMDFVVSYIQVPCQCFHNCSYGLISIHPNCLCDKEEDISVANAGGIPSDSAYNNYTGATITLMQSHNSYVPYVIEEPKGWIATAGFWSNSTYSPSGILTHMTAIRDEIQQPSMLVSPFYLQSTVECRLSFELRVEAMDHRAGIIVTTQTLSSINTNNNNNNTGYSGGEIPRQHYAYYFQYKDQLTKFKKDIFKIANVTLGYFSEPYRIRIECHATKKRYSKKQSGTICFIRNIKLSGCSDPIPSIEPSVCTQSSFICNSSRHIKCISRNDVCDMQDDCGNGQDEINCAGYANRSDAQCGFSTYRNCSETWKHRSNKKYHNQGAVEDLPLSFINLVSINSIQIENKLDINAGPMRPLHGPDDKFLFFSYDSHKKTNKQFDMDKFSGDVKYIYFLMSPIYPPTNLEAYNPNYPLYYNTCNVRFFTCFGQLNGARIEVNLAPEQAEISPTTLLYQLENTDSAAGCKWVKHIVPIPQMRFPYFLSIDLVITLSMANGGFIAIDDISISPSCFPKNELTFEPEESYNISTCGATGPNLPNNEECWKMKKAKDVFEPIYHSSSGEQVWATPRAGIYRIKMCGGSGGQLPSQKSKLNGWKENGGECLIFVYEFKYITNITMSIGQKGSCPCDEDIQSYNERMRHIVCTEKLPDIDILKRIAPSEIGGCGGGGATRLRFHTFLSQKREVYIAGGGGGQFPSYLVGYNASQSWPQKSMTIGKFSNNYFDSIPLAGSGLNLSASKSFNKPSANIWKNYQLLLCKNCEAYTPTKQTISKKCPDGTSSGRGGIGGGGTSCGPAGAGGGGFQGGRPSFLDYGESGTNTYPGYMEINQDEKNSGDGFVHFKFCSLECLNSTCGFVGLTEEMRCICTNGIPQLEGLCKDKEVQSSAYSIWLICGFAIMTIFSILFCVLFLIQRRRQKRRIVETIPLMTMIDMTNAIYGNMEISNMTYADCLKYLNTLDRNRISLLQIIGKGAFGEVWEGRLYSECGDIAYPVAIKTLNSKYMGREKSQKDFLYEALCSRRFLNENILHLHGINFDCTPHYLIFELMAGGDLVRFLQESRMTINTTNPYELDVMGLYRMVHNVATACAVLEKNKFVHRDMSARNCLLTMKGKGRVVKIADFGMARDIYDNNYYRRCGRMMLPVRWMPPEALSDGLFTTSTDVWSFGVLCWEIFSFGLVPYLGLTNEMVMQKILQGARLEAPKDIYHQMYELMMKCWETLPSNRPTFVEILNDLERIMQSDYMETAVLPVPIGPNELDETPIAPTPTTITSSLYTPSTPNDKLYCGGVGLVYDACEPFVPSGGQTIEELARQIQLEEEEFLNEMNETLLTQESGYTSNGQEFTHVPPTPPSRRPRPTSLNFNNNSNNNNIDNSTADD